MRDWKFYVSKAIGVAFIGSLLFYTSTRTIDFLQMLLPQQLQGAAVYALVAFGIGGAYWSFEFCFGARDHKERALAAIMIIIDVMGDIIGFAGDTFIYAQKKGLLGIPEWMLVTAIVATCGLISLNVILGLMHFMQSWALEIPKEGARDIAPFHIPSWNGKKGEETSTRSR